MKSFLIIPAYNEGVAIAQVISGTKFYVDKIVVVDDGSTDQTLSIAENNGAYVLSHAVNRGYGASLHTGSMWAISQGADAIIHFDADGQHSPQDLPLILEPIIQGKCDAVLGSRFLSEVKTKPPLGRKILLKAAVLFTGLVSGLRVSDTHNGFRAFTKDAYMAMDLKQDRMAYSSEILAEIKRLNLRFIEVPTNIIYSPYSLNKGQNWLSSFQILWQLVRSKLIR